MLCLPLRTRSAITRNREPSLEAKVSKEEGWKRTISVTVPVDEVETAYSQTIAKYRQKAKISGFRPGKAPLDMVERQYTEEIKQDVLEAMVPHAFEEALRQLSLSPLGTPELSAIKFERGTPLTFEASFEIRPQVEVKGYSGLKLTKRVYEVTEHDIDEALVAVRDGAATTIEVQRPAREGDVVVVNMQKIYDRNNRVKQNEFPGLRVELHAERTRPELFKALVGMTVGEGKEVEIAYPEDESDPALAGNTVLYRAWMKQVLQKQLPPLDDELAKKVSGDQIETLAALRDVMRKDMEHRAESAAQRDLRGQMRQMVVGANPIEVPAGFLEEHLNEVTERFRSRDQKVAPEAVRAQFEPMAVEQFRWDFCASEIAKKEGIGIPDAEVEAVAKSWPKSDKERPDDEKIHWTLLEMRVYDWLLSHAEVQSEKFQPTPHIITP
jgi:trigger factor